tara:strand:+ start:494 stop:733 length:240 start_codon:yes stop_codon:yes gene_type:complete
MTRNELKDLWFSIPRQENKKEIRVVSLESHTDWFIVRVITDVVGYYSTSSAGFYTLESAMKFAQERVKNLEGNYKLLLK